MYDLTHLSSLRTSWQTVLLGITNIDIRFCRIVFASQSGRTSRMYFENLSHSALCLVSKDSPECVGTQYYRGLWEFTMGRLWKHCTDMPSPEEPMILSSYHRSCVWLGSNVGIKPPRQTYVCCSFRIMFFPSLLVIQTQAILAITPLFLSFTTARSTTSIVSQRGLQDVPTVNGSSAAGWQSLPSLQGATVYPDWSLGSGAAIVGISISLNSLTHIHCRHYISLPSKTTHQ